MPRGGILVYKLYKLYWQLIKVYGGPCDFDIVIVGVLGVFERIGFVGDWRRTLCRL